MATLSFKFCMEADFPFPVEVKVPNPNVPGQFTTHHFVGRFKSLATTEARAMLDASDADTANDADKAMLRQVVTGWDLAEAFSPAGLEEAMDNPYILRGLLNAYTNAVRGKAVTTRQEKN